MKKLFSFGFFLYGLGVFLSPIVTEYARENDDSGKGEGKNTADYEDEKVGGEFPVLDFFFECLGASAIYMLLAVSGLMSMRIAKRAGLMMLKLVPKVARFA